MKTKNTLKLLIEFSNTDLENLKVRDYRALYDNIMGLVRTGEEQLLSVAVSDLDMKQRDFVKKSLDNARKKFPLPFGKMDMSMLQTIQDEFRQQTENIFEAVNTAKVEPGKLKYEDFGEGGKRIIHSIQRIKFSIELDISIHGNAGEPDKAKIVSRELIIPEDEDNLVKEYSRILFILFARELNRFPLHSIKKCEHCGSWFFQLQKREKKYCSDRCTKNGMMQQYRDKKKVNDPEAYKKELKAGAKRSRKSYEKKVKRKAPNADIERRPYKYKED